MTLRLLKNSEGNHDGQWIFCRWKEAAVGLFLQLTRTRKIRKIRLANLTGRLLSGTGRSQSNEPWNTKQTKRIEMFFFSKSDILAWANAIRTLLFFVNYMAIHTAAFTPYKYPRLKNSCVAFHRFSSVWAASMKRSSKIIFFPSELICYTAVLSVCTQGSSLPAAAENRTTSLSSS